MEDERRFKASIFNGGKEGYGGVGGPSVMLLYLSLKSGCGCFSWRPESRREIEKNGIHIRINIRRTVT